MTNKTKTLILLFPLLLIFSETDSFGYELERNEAFTKNKFLQIKPNGAEIEKISREIKPDINLKGASDEEEKEMLSAFFNLGYTIYLILFNYEAYPLEMKIGDTTTKEVIISNLRKLRDLMAELEADERLLELINDITNRIEKESIRTKESNSETLALLNELLNRIGTHIENTFGLSYKIHYSFGVWTNQVMTLCEFRISYDEAIKQLSKEEKGEILGELTQELKNLLKLAETYKSQLKELTNKAEGRNLDNLYETASEIRGVVEIQTAKRLYDYCLNIYYGILPA